MTEIAKFFETKTRQSGEPFVTLTDEAPEWLRNAVRDAHNRDLPLDWVFAECREACAAIDEGTLGGDDDDGLHEWADGRVDVYTKNIFLWAAELCLTNTYAAAEEEAEELGASDDVGLNVCKTLQTIQYCAIRTIASYMIQAAKDAAHETEGDG